MIFFVILPPVADFLEGMGDLGSANPKCRFSFSLTWVNMGDLGLMNPICRFSFFRHSIKYRKKGGVAATAGIPQPHKCNFSLCILFYSIYFVAPHILCSRIAPTTRIPLILHAPPCKMAPSSCLDARQMSAYARASTAYADA